jgi:hypothetical protein
MAYLVSDLVSRVRLELIDIASVDASRSWQDVELIGDVNAANSATALIKPDACVLHAEMPLAAGVLQTLPAGSVGLKDIPYNTGVGGLPGAPIRPCDKSRLNHARPTWTTDAASTTILHFMYDPEDPLNFGVYPPAATGASVHTIVFAVPTKVATLTDIMPISPIYDEALFNYVMALALGKNTQRGDTAKWSAYRNAWIQLVGAKTQAQLALAPMIDPEMK